MTGHSRWQRRNHHGGKQLARLKRGFITAELKITQRKLPLRLCADEFDTGIQSGQYGRRIGLIIPMGEIAAEGGHVADADVRHHMAGFAEGGIVQLNDSR